MYSDVFLILIVNFEDFLHLARREKCQNMYFIILEKKDK